MIEEENDSQPNLGPYSFKKSACLLPGFLLLSDGELAPLFLGQILDLCGGKIWMMILGRRCRYLRRRLSPVLVRVHAGRAEVWAILLIFDLSIGGNSNSALFDLAIIFCCFLLVSS